MNSANAQVCLEVSLKKTFTTKREKKLQIANEMFFFSACLLYSPHHAESAIHNALSTPSGFLRRENTERDVVREIIGSFWAFLRVRLGLREGGRNHGWID